MIFFLVLGWEDALQRDAERQNQKGLHIQMRLAATDGGDAGGLEGDQIAGRMIDFGQPPSQNTAGGWDDIGAGVCSGLHQMAMSGQLRNRQCVPLFAAAFTQGMSATHVDGCAPTQIGQPKVHSAIPTIGGAQKRE